MCFCAVDWLSADRLWLAGCCSFLTLLDGRRHSGGDFSSSTLFAESLGVHFLLSEGDNTYAKLKFRSIS